MDDKPSRVTIAVDSQCTISAIDKSGGLMAPHFASRLSEAAMNLSDLSEVTEVLPVQHVPGNLNPADIPTRANSVATDIIWQGGPAYLSRGKEDWPFTREFIDYVPEHEMRTPKAVFNLAEPETWKSPLGEKIDKVVCRVMELSNCLDKTVNVTARILKCMLKGDRNLISSGYQACKDCTVHLVYGTYYCCVASRKTGLLSTFHQVRSRLC